MIAGERRCVAEATHRGPGGFWIQARLIQHPSVARGRRILWLRRFRDQAHRRRTRLRCAWSQKRRMHQTGPISRTIPEKFYGEVPEWSNGLAWKVSVRVKPYRGFESLPLRQF